MAMSEARLIVTDAEMWPWHPWVEAGDAANILQCSGRPPHGTVCPDVNSAEQPGLEAAPALLSTGQPPSQTPPAGSGWRSAGGLVVRTTTS